MSDALAKSGGAAGSGGAPAGAPPTETSEQNTWGWILTGAGVLALKVAKDVGKEVWKEMAGKYYDEAMKGAGKAIAGILRHPAALPVAAVTAYAAYTAAWGAAVGTVGLTRMNSHANVAIRQQMGLKFPSRTGYSIFMRFPLTVK